MNDEQIKRILEGAEPYNNTKEDTIRSMIRDFYSRKMLSTIILVWGWAIIFLAGFFYCLIQFFKADQAKSQIMYAALFICSFHGVGLIKVFAWEMMHRNSIKREIKKLELRIIELTRLLANQSND